MAVDFGDHASGFRHNEVIRFVNNEVLMNGGGPDFYMAFRLRPWTEVEDRLQAVLVDPQVPRTLKRACAWSALALGVRAAERQREQQMLTLQQLQQQLEDRQAASWTLASELKHLREERDSLAAQLRSTQAILQQTLSERDLMRWRLLRAEKATQTYLLSQEVVGDLGAEQLGGVPWCLGEDPKEAVSVGAEGVPNLEAQIPVPETLLYMPTTSPWFQAVQPSLPISLSHPHSSHALLSMGLTCSTPIPAPGVKPAGAMGTLASQAESASQFHPEKSFPSGLWATQGSPDVMAQLCDPNGQGQYKYPENFLGDSIHHCHSQEEDPVCPLGTACLRDNSILEKEVLIMPHGLMPQGESNNHDSNIHPGMSQRMGSPGQGSSRDKKEPLMPHRMATLIENNSDENKDLVVMLQGPAAKGVNSSLNQKEDPETRQETVPPGQSSSAAQENDSTKPQVVIHLEPSIQLAQKKDSVMSQGMATMAQNSSHIQRKDPVMPSGGGSMEDNMNHNQKKDPIRPQETTSLSQSSSHTQKNDLLNSQGKAPLGQSNSSWQKKDPQMPNEIAPRAPSRHLGQKKDPVMPQMTATLGQNSSHNLKSSEFSDGIAPLQVSSKPDPKKDTIMSQGKVAFGHSRSHTKEDRVEKSLATPLSEKNCGGKKIIKKQQAQAQPQKAKQPKGKRVLEFYHRKAAAYSSLKDWDCPYCKSSNFYWRISCYKCRKSCIMVKNGCVAPKQTH
ncbi:putative testis-expressed protein 13C [Ochotona curzoniae]|uniref:putative testis-expressed protein 13C n=1 Tax=Ochotona curzoniae TaxID=130825 RepID=UPI001B3512F5|nr:putative testis-expressed protein 13C [Ochotona curzoniae]